MRAQEIRELTDDEIDAQIETARSELFNLRFRASFEDTDTGVIRTKRRTRLILGLPVLLIIRVAFWLSHPDLGSMPVPFIIYVTWSQPPDPEPMPGR